VLSSTFSMPPKLIPKELEDILQAIKDCLTSIQSQMEAKKLVSPTLRQGMISFILPLRCCRTRFPLFLFLNHHHLLVHMNTPPPCPHLFHQSDHPNSNLLFLKDLTPWTGCSKRNNTSTFITFPHKIDYPWFLFIWEGKSLAGLNGCTKIILLLIGHPSHVP